jgi:hypothetical protein
VSTSTPALRRKDSPARIEVGDDELVTRSAAVIQAAGYQLVPLSRPIGPWALLATCGHGLLLVSVVREAWPSTMGALWGHPPGWPINTRRLIHRWTDKPLPEALSLS